MSESPGSLQFRRDHHWTPRQMSAYLDGDLAPSARQRVQRHLHDCPECRAALRTLTRLLDLMHAVAPAAVDGSGLVDRVLVRVRGDAR